MSNNRVSPLRFSCLIRKVHGGIRRTEIGIFWVRKEVKRETHMRPLLQSKCYNRHCIAYICSIFAGLLPIDFTNNM